MSFKNLKKNSSNSLLQMQEAAKKLTAKATFEDDSADFWTLTVDKKTGVGYAILRLMPAPENEDIPFVRYYDHAFKGPTGKWYIERSLTTFGKGSKDPVAESNSELWNSGPEGQKIVRGDGTRENPGRKRREHYVVNVYIVDDPAKPELNGTVKKFKFGKKIFEMINSAMHPEFPGVQAMDPFSLWEGANFILRAKNVDGQRTYSASGWADKGPLLNDDDALEAIWKTCYSLNAEIDPNGGKYITYEEAERKLNLVIGAKPSLAPKTITEAPKAAPAPATAKAEAAPWEADEAEEDDPENMSFFKNLATGK